MLPKPEKSTKRTTSTGQQLDLVKEIDVSKNIESKRKTVIILLVATIGLSLSFAVYRTVKSFLAAPRFPQVSLPRVNINTSHNSNQDIDTQIKNIIDPSSWSLQVISIKDKPLTIYSLNPDTDFNADTSSTVKELSVAPAYPDSPIVDIIPQGVEYHQKVNSTPTSIEHLLLINLPKQKLLFLSRLNSSDTSLFKSSLPQIIETLYWYSIKIE